MELFNGLLKVIEEKSLRQKYGSGVEGRLFAFWLNGWPVKKPPSISHERFWDKETTTHIYLDIFGPYSYPELLGRIISYIDEIKKHGENNYELHLTTCADEWLPDDLKDYAQSKEKATDRLQTQLKILKKFITELCGEAVAGKVFLNVDGEHSEEERKSMCKLLISDL